MSGLTGCGTARVDRPWLADCRTCGEARRSATEPGARVLAEAHRARNPHHDVQAVHRPNPRPRPDRGAGETYLLLALAILVLVIVAVATQPAADRLQHTCDQIAATGPDRCELIHP